MRYIVFCVWLLFSNRRTETALLLYVPAAHSLLKTQFVYHPVGRCLDCSQFGAIISSAALDILVRFFFGPINSFLLDMPLGGIAGS